MPGRPVRRQIVMRFLRRLGGDRRGNVAIISALALPVLLGSFGLGTEVASWYSNQRALQNAADSAAIAAATNGSSGYADEARAVTAQYGLVDGQGGVTVAVANNAACPGGGSTCYSVTIRKPLPLILAGFVGSLLFVRHLSNRLRPTARRQRRAELSMRRRIPRPRAAATPRAGRSAVPR